MSEVVSVPPQRCVPGVWATKILKSIQGVSLNGHKRIFLNNSSLAEKSGFGKIPHVLVDLRPKAEMEQGFILGAVSIPFAELASRKAEFPKQKNAPIVFYGPDREKAARLAVSQGYKAV